MTDQRVELVARVLWDQDGYDLDADPDGSTARELRPEYEAKARAVLAALSRPTSPREEA